MAAESAAWWSYRPLGRGGSVGCILTLYVAGRKPGGWPRRIPGPLPGWGQQADTMLYVRWPAVPARSVPGENEEQHGRPDA